MTTLLRDLVPIPERVHKGDFVLRLSEGVVEPEGTLRDYVVTPQLAEAFDHSLRILENALSSRSSKAAYLHGSFGSGKSHFMAVLYLLLRREPRARAVAELAPLLARHDSWMDGKRFLLVPYHLIGAKNLESAILGGYAAHLRQVHPEASPPAVYLAESLFADAEKLRAKMGDEAFFAGLGGGGGGDDGWGDLAESGWTAADYERARGAAELASFDRPDAAPAASHDRQRLIGDLVGSYFSSYGEVAGGSGSGFVTLDHGLAELSRHAQSLGYDGLVLFLDELILWLASHAADMDFLQEEGQKLSKIVEAGGARRPIPIVSFVARQRDLKELVGDHVPGAEKLGFADILNWWQGRFDTVTLENRNLPVIVERRLLRPRDEAARAQLDEAFDATKREREKVLAVLQGREANLETFRRVYPFSPALIDTLVAVSSVLQRERTALKLLLQLLVDQRDELVLGDLVPVGDLWDVLASGEEPFTEEMRRHFQSASRLWNDKLLPLLEAEHQLAADARPEPGTPAEKALRADERILKTLLLAALAPEAESLKGLTVSDLAALNHGTFRAPIPGHESRLILNKLRKWAGQVGEIRIGEEPHDPRVNLQVTGVDVETILAHAQNEDNQGNRRKKIKDLLFEALEIGDTDHLFARHAQTWRGTDREIDVVFGNVRELADETLTAQPGRWRLVVDYPFDREGSTEDDLERLRQYREETSTVCWMPAFFSAAAQTDVGKLVVLDYLLTGERFEQHTTHLSAVQRPAARTLLENQRNQLRHRVKRNLEAAYGVAQADPGVLDAAHDPGEHFHSLRPGFSARPPVGGSLRQSLLQLTDQMLRFEFPAHPELLVPAKPRALQSVFEEVLRAIEDPDQRVRIEDRKVRERMKGLADPLKLGRMHEAHFVLVETWTHHFHRVLAQEDERWTVARLRRALDEPRPMGLPVAVADLVIRVFAARTNRTFVRHGGPWLDEVLTRELPEDVELVALPMPSEDEWTTAVERGDALFGLPLLSRVRSAASVADLGEKARRAADERKNASQTLEQRLATRAKKLGVPDDAPRLVSARSAVGLIRAILGAGDAKSRVEALARADLGASPAAVARSMASAERVERALESAQWTVFESVWSLEDARRERAQRNQERVVEILTHDELALALGSALEEAQREAVKILTDVPPPPPIHPPPPPPVRGRRVVDASAGEKALTPEAARSLFARLAGSLAESPERRLRITWTIDEPDDP